VVVPGAVILFVSGAWMTAEVWGGWELTQQPWLAGMILLFMIEFVEGNTVTRLYFSGDPLVSGAWRTAEVWDGWEFTQQPCWPG
jgi:hypothetical protein